MQEFIPRGRQAVEEHPGPLASKHQVNVSSEHLLLHRLQNVNISNDGIYNSAENDNSEHWSINEIHKHVETCWQSNSLPADCKAGIPSFMNEFIVNSEEELYFKGHTAVWTRGIAADDGVLPRTCFTCDTPIKHAFFCAPNFIRTKEPDKRMSQAQLDIVNKQQDEISGICLIGLQ